MYWSVLRFNWATQRWAVKFIRADTPYLNEEYLQKEQAKLVWSLKNNPTKTGGNNTNIHDEMTFLVRQLEPTEKGLPIQIYVFSNDIDWIRYEEIQSDIFDHLLAVVPEFGLKIFQSPTGKDFEELGKSSASV